MSYFFINQTTSRTDKNILILVLDLEYTKIRSFGEA